MKKKKSIKKANKKSKNNTYSLLLYVENNSPKLKKFSTNKELGEFIDDFNRKYPDYMLNESDNWIDFCVTDIKGDIHFFCDGIEVE